MEAEENELDSTCGVPDEELTRRFCEAVRIDNEISRIKGSPIARYDAKCQSAYLEYADGSREYAKKPEAIVFAGPNGSGKSTVTKLAIA